MIDPVFTLSQKTVMYLNSLHQNDLGFEWRAGARLGTRNIVRNIVLMTIVMMAVVGLTRRSPVSTPLDPLAGLEIKRQFLAGSDALLERGVIPPNTPDWILTDCTASKKSNAYDRVHQALCESVRQN